MSLFKVGGVSGVERGRAEVRSNERSRPFKVVAVSAVERASTEGRSGKRSCCCLKCNECALWSVRVQKRG